MHPFLLTQTLQVQKSPRLKTLKLEDFKTSVDLTRLNQSNNLTTAIQIK
jgi:hypothetical protein